MTWKTNLAEEFNLLILIHDAITFGEVFAAGDDKHVLCRLIHVREKFLQ